MVESWSKIGRFFPHKFRARVRILPINHCESHRESFRRLGHAPKKRWRDLHGKRGRGLRICDYNWESERKGRG